MKNLILRFLKEKYDIISYQVEELPNNEILFNINYNNDNSDIWNSTTMEQILYKDEQLYKGSEIHPLNGEWMEYEVDLKKSIKFLELFIEDKHGKVKIVDIFISDENHISIDFKIDKLYRYFLKGDELFEVPILPFGWKEHISINNEWIVFKRKYKLKLLDKL